MPRYFFHLDGLGERIADRRGQILPDEAAALREANLVAAAWAPPATSSQPINGQQPLLFDASGALALSELVCSLKHKK